MACMRARLGGVALSGDRWRFLAAPCWGSFRRADLQEPLGLWAMFSTQREGGCHSPWHNLTSTFAES